ncbi:hypothetical protein An09g01590 [Aspergillus niger]|uniref:Uncharacterized protein n=2 Tax=Aspergillus niger TaxID=5061 RepID=A2QTC4_ASPNC|nr:hypothetical protein An09g01590 [Aspergillus niger]CAK49080.1 hypothetical protein An09g01590 [Aspergillus niger]
MTAMEGGYSYCFIAVFASTTQGGDHSQETPEYVVKITNLPSALRRFQIPTCNRPQVRHRPQTIAALGGRTRKGNTNQRDYEVQERGRQRGALWWAQTINRWISFVTFTNTLVGHLGDYLKVLIPPREILQSADRGLRARLWRMGIFTFSRGSLGARV